MMRAAAGAHEPTSDIMDVYRSCKGTLAWVAGFGCCINILMFTGPLFMLQVYDRVLTSRSLDTLWALTFLVAMLFVFMGLLDFVRSRTMARVGRRVDELLSARLFDAVIAPTGKNVKSMNAAMPGGQPLRDLDSIRQFLSGPAPHTLFDVPWVPIFLAVNFLLHFWLGLFATLGACVLLAMAVFNEAATRRPMAKASRAIGGAHEFADEARRNSEVVHALGMGHALRERWSTIRSKAIADQEAGGDKGSTMSIASKTMRMFMQSAMLALGAYLSIYGEITPGTMIAASIIMSRALSPIEQSIVHWRSFANVRRASGRLQKVLETAAKRPTKMSLPKPTGNVHVDKIIVLAPDHSKPVLQGIDFSLSTGQVLGLIGPSGAGKTTLSRVLVGAWPVAKGAVRFDGAPIEQWPAAEIGPSLGYLPQNVELFAGTIEENISRFTATPDPHAVVQAAMAANVHDIILRLPDGYRQRIGEGGASLSAGQRQRIGLARALYNDPAFVVLDEPNAHLDTEGEDALVRSIRGLKARGITMVIVAHRPSALVDADYLLFLRDGRQVAFGPREDVMRTVAPPPERKVDASGRPVMTVVTGGVK